MKSLTTLLFFSIICNLSFAQIHEWTRTNPGGGGAFSTIEAGPPSPTNGAMQIIAASDLSGAYYSWDGGANWQVYGSERGLLATHVSGIGFHPTDAEIFFLGVDGGIYKSSTGGGFLYSVLDDGYITDIEVSEVNPQIVYAAYHSMYNTNDGEVYKSIDGGETFSRMSNNSLVDGLHLLEVIAHPLNINIVYALAGEGRFATGPAVAFRSIDGGVNWTQLTPSAEDVLHLALDGNTLYLSTMLTAVDNNGNCVEGNNGHLYKSTDSGSSWSSGALANITGIIFIDFNQPNKIRLIDPRCPFFWLNDSGTWTSTDAGNSWTHTGFTANWSTGYQAVDSPQWSYGTSYNGLSKTLGGSKTDPDALFWTNIQWTFGSFDGGTTFNHLHTQAVGDHWQSTGLDNVVMLDIEANANNPDEVYIGYADIGLWRSTDGGQSWQASNPEIYTGNWQGFGGNCYSVLTDPAVAGKVWASLQGDGDEPVSLIYSTSSGALNSWTKIGTGIPPSTTNLWGLSLDETSNINNRTLFATADGDVYRSVNNGLNWALVLSNGALYYTAVDQQNGQIVYAGGADGLYRSTNGGNSWTQLVNPPAQANNSNSNPYDEEYIGVSSIVTDTDNEGEIFYSYYGGNSSIGGAYHLENNQIQLLYSTPYLRCVAVNPANSDQIYAGSSYAFFRGFYHADSEGVLYSSDGGANWSEVNGDMPWHFAVCMEITEESMPQIFVGNTGSGFQYTHVGGESSTLVVEMSSFNARAKGNHIELNWYTTSEQNNRGFYLQKSNALNGYFTNIGWVKGNYSSQINHEYQYIDNDVEAKTMYFYRLAQIDEDEPITYSSIVSAQVNSEFVSYRLYPNPTRSSITILTTNEAIESAAIYNQQGQVVYQNNKKRAMGNKESLDISNLNTGIYLVVLQINGEVFYERLVKE